MWTKRTRTQCAGWGRALLAGLALIGLVLSAHGQIEVQTIGGGPRLNSCAAFAGFASGDTYTNAQFNDPYASALDSKSNLWVADTGNSDVEQITMAGDRVNSLTIHTYTYTAITNNSGNILRYQTNYHPFPKVNGIAVDRGDNVYVLMPSNGFVVKFDQYLNILSQIYFTADKGIPMASAITVDANSNVFLSFTNGMIVRFQLIDSAYAPVYSNSLSSGTGQLPMSTVVKSFKWQPSALAIRADGQIAVSDTLSNAIYLVSTNANSTPALLTGGNGVGSRDGGPQFARFDQPHGIAASADGRMVVCDMNNNSLRIIDANSNVTTLYGTASNVWTTTECDAVPALFRGWVDGAPGITTTSASGRQPASVTISSTGDLFVTEKFYSLIRSVSGTGLSPVNAVGVALNKAPVVTTLFATNISSTTAVLNSSVDPEGEPTSAYFFWGTSSTNGFITSAIPVTNNLNITNQVNFTLSNLQPSTTYFFAAQAVNSTGTGSGSELVFTTLAASQPPTVSFSPSSGYFPECITVQVTSSVPAVYYTTDNIDPTTNSQPVEMFVSTNGGYVGFIQWCNAQLDLSSLRVAAFDGAKSSTTIPGQSPQSSVIGFANPVQSGSGDVAYIPLVVDLSAGGKLKSLQFRVEVTPNDSSTPRVAALGLQPITANDYLQVAGPNGANTPLGLTNFSPYTTGSNGLGLLVSASGVDSGLDIEKFGVAVLLRVQIPKTAAYGQSYSLNVLFPTGTSDGVNQAMPLSAMPAQTLMISDPASFAGDSTPPSGYNNGEFGDFSLDNSDANAVLYALLNIRRPYSDSDAFKAMDVFPETPGIIGDGFLTFLDWQTVLYRSVGLDTNNWIRYWTNGELSHAQVSWVPGGFPELLSDTSAATVQPKKLLATPTPPGLVWLSQISLSAGSVSYGLPGNSASVPVYANVLPGYNVSGMAFRAMAVGNNGAPAVGQIQFTPASGIAPPQVSAGLSSSDIVCAWNVGGFTPGLQGSNYLGTISFQIPPGAQTGQSYSVQFVVGGGAADLSTEYQMESFPGSVWIGAAAQPPLSVTSDEWKTAFFGSAANPLAADNADPDGDGVPNWMEYLAGTNPTNAASVFAFSSAAFNKEGQQGVSVNWLTAPGKNYILESQSDLGGKEWTPISTNTGDGNNFQLLITNYSGNSRFYQIQLQP